VLQPNVSNINAIDTIIFSYVKNTTIAVGWFYSAAFSPLLDTLEFDTIIYDCTNEYKDESAHLIEQEKYLMANADSIFAGGKPLYDSKKQLHPNVHYFPSCADKNHFSKALNNISIPADIGDIQGPIVGYCGVIDESVNLDLVYETAKKMPHISFVMIGQLEKVASADLPQEANIHYLGMKCYNELPHYLKAFDIAMMPFTLNGGRKYISNTKTLEYMAAGKPIISTKITDIEHYSSCINLVASATEFAETISSVINKHDQKSMKNEYQKILTSNCWDTTVEQMKSVLNSFVK